MPIINKNKFSKKRISFLLAEAKSEKFLARIRFTLALICASFSLYFFGADKIDFLACSIQIGLLISVCLYSGLFCFEIKIGPVYRYIAYISSLVDITIVSAFIWTFHAAGMPHKWIFAFIFPAYVVVIGFTALHNRKALPLFTGFFTICAFYLVYFFILKPKTCELDCSFQSLISGLTILILTTLLSELISRNNVIALNKIIDSEGKFYNLGKTLPLLLFKVDKKGKIIWANIPLNNQYGISAGRMIGKNINDFIDDSENFKFTGDSVQGTFKVKNFSSDVKYVDCVIQSYRDQREPKILEGSMVDVTRRKMAVSQREEMEKRLFQYKKMESLGTLASGMAHDFNNILQAITDIIDHISRETSEPETHKGMALISETLTDAKFLISELFAFGRKKPLNYELMNITDFIRKIIPDYNRLIGNMYEVKDIIHKDKLFIQGDANYLKRIFQNLFINARDAMPDGGMITIECFLQESHSQNRTVVIRFSDTGIGVPQKIVEKIFDPFFTTKKKGKGTGLGLALVRKIISLHKGDVFLEKSDLHGTTFRIEIPECSSKTDLDTKAFFINHLPATILLLDDDPKIRNILAFFLSEFSYKTYESSTMTEGIKVLKEHINDCNVLIMDWKLGDANPHNVIDRFRAVKPDLIIIVVSGYPPDEKSIKMKNIFRWFTKPYDKNRLDHEIQKALHTAGKK